MLGPSGCLRGPGACKRGRRTRRKKEEELSGKEPEENPAEEEGISNRPIYPIFIPPLTILGPGGISMNTSYWVRSFAPAFVAKYTILRVSFSIAPLISFWATGWRLNNALPHRSHFLWLFWSHNDLAITTKALLGRFRYRKDLICLSNILSFCFEPKKSYSSTSRKSAILASRLDGVGQIGRFEWR